MRVIELIADYLIRRELFNTAQDKLSRYETELAILNSNLKPTQMNSSESTTRQPTNSYKILNQINRIDQIKINISEQSRLIELYEPLFQKSREEIKILYNEFSKDRESKSKEKNILITFFLRDFKRFTLPYDDIAAILDVSNSYLQRMYKEAMNTVNVCKKKRLEEISKENVVHN